MMIILLSVSSLTNTVPMIYFKDLLHPEKNRCKNEIRAYLRTTTVVLCIGVNFQFAGSI